MSRPARPAPSYDDLVGSEDLRIGDAERESAIQALGEHFSAGRLTVDEYGERTAQVTTAKTAGELGRQFTDLPAPHPRLTTGTSGSTQGAAQGTAPAEPPVPARVAARSDDPDVQRWLARPPIQRAAGALVGVSWLIGIGLMVATHLWLFLFLPLVLSIVFGSMWGNGWDRDRNAYHRAQRRQDRYDRRSDRRA